jgi:calcium-translocating P-type ATPase
VVARSEAGAAAEVQAAQEYTRQVLDWEVIELAKHHFDDRDPAVRPTIGPIIPPRAEAPDLGSSVYQPEGRRLREQMGLPSLRGARGAARPPAPPRPSAPIRLFVMVSSTPAARAADPRERIDLLLRDLRADVRGLSEREAGRRLIIHGPNEFGRRARRSVWSDIRRQLTHPLALLLWAAAGLALIEQNRVLAMAIATVIVLNAVFAFVQERQAEQAVEALASYLPPHASVLRDGRSRSIDIRDIVPGDIVILAEGDRTPADVRLIEGTVEVDLSMLTGESVPLLRSAELVDITGSLLEARDLVFSGTTVTTGSARALVFATGSRTEIGRLAALSERVRPEESPLERQVRRAAYLISAVAIAMGLAFLPMGWLLAGLSFEDSLAFTIGLLVANVPEGLLPTITLALALSVRALSRKGALVKRLSAVETLGSTTVICTDKTGTLTENRMRVERVWTPGVAPNARAGDVLAVAARCSTAQSGRAEEGASGDPMEVALIEAAEAAGRGVDPRWRVLHRRRVLPFESTRRCMSTIDDVDGRLWSSTKGAPEAVLALTSLAERDGEVVALGAELRSEVDRVVAEMADTGLRILAVARRPIAPEEEAAPREVLERELTLVGLVGLADPPRATVPSAIADCRAAGIRIVIVTGDHPRTAAAVARAIGMGHTPMTIVEGSELDGMGEQELDELLREPRDLIVARSSPETKLRIADSLRAEGHVVAMTGDGVNDAPALRRADIGVAMGRSGTDVAREAATMILTNDDFAALVSAVAAGRQIYDNVRRFIVYIFAHAPPEVVPFLLFALSGGAIPLPLTVLQILAIDLGTETLPALALGREPAEPGVMKRPPRPRDEGVITREMLVRAWAILGLVSTVLVVGGFFFVLLRAGWRPGVPVGPGSTLHIVYRQATTMTFVGIVACQIGTALSVRARLEGSLFAGIGGNRLLLVGFAFEIAFTLVLVFVPTFQATFGTARLGLTELLFVAPFPFVVWGADEVVRRLSDRQDRDVRVASSIRRRSPAGVQ